MFRVPNYFHQPFGGGRFRYHDLPAGTEPLPPGTIVEVAENDGLVRARDRISDGFVQYVRPDDMAVGKQVATFARTITSLWLDRRGNCLDSKNVLPGP